MPKKESVATHRQESLDGLYAALDKIAPGAGRPLDRQQIVPLERTPTSSPILNWVLGGGMPKGRIIEIYGAESSGKTTLALDVLANHQRLGGRAAFIDAEHAFDPQWAQRLGVNVEELLFHQPDTGEQALEVVEVMVRSGLVGCIVIDSVSALVPAAEIKGEMGDAHVGLQARLMSQAMRKLAGAANRHGSTLIFINQLREKVGVMFGSPETTSGGRALKFYASIRLDVRRGELVKNGDAVVGGTIRVKAVKNKTCPPYRSGLVPLDFDLGLDQVGELVDLGVEFGLLVKNGAFYYLADGKTRLGQGRAAAIAAVRADDVLRQELLPKLLEALTTGAVRETGER